MLLGDYSAFTLSWQLIVYSRRELAACKLWNSLPVDGFSYVNCHMNFMSIQVVMKAVGHARMRKM